MRCCIPASHAGNRPRSDCCRPTEALTARYARYQSLRHTYISATAIAPPRCRSRPRDPRVCPTGISPTAHVRRPGFHRDYRTSRLLGWTPEEQAAGLRWVKSPAWMLTVKMQFASGRRSRRRGRTDFSACGDRYLLFSWVYDAGQFVASIWRANSDGSAPQHLTSGRFDLSPLMFADGKWVYYIDRLGALAIVNASARGRGQPRARRRFREHPQSILHRGRVFYFASDGKSIGFAVDLIDPRTNDALAKLAIISLEPGSSTDPDCSTLIPVSARGMQAANFKLVPRENAVAYPFWKRAYIIYGCNLLNGSPWITNSPISTSEQIF